MPLSVFTKLLMKKFTSKEMSFELEIRTIDNPGWDLQTNGLGSSRKLEINNDRSEDDWFIAEIRGGELISFGDPSKLVKIVSQFCELLGGEEDLELGDDDRRTFKEDHEILECFQDWYLSQCDGDWEHCYGHKFTFSRANGCQALIHFAETELDEENFPQELLKTKSASLSIKLEDEKFLANGSLCDFREIIKIFVSWIERANSDSLKVKV